MSSTVSLCSISTRFYVALDTAKCWISTLGPHGEPVRYFIFRRRKDDRNNPRQLVDVGRNGSISSREPSVTFRFRLTFPITSATTNTKAATASNDDDGTARFGKTGSASTSAALSSGRAALDESETVGSPRRSHGTMSPDTERTFNCRRISPITVGWRMDGVLGGPRR